MKKVEYVYYKQVYDLVFRARSAKLNSTAFVLDYWDWIKAGVAYNTRGFALSTRKISYFAELYKVIEEERNTGNILVFEEHKGMLAESFLRYYQDIYEIYQDHLWSKQTEHQRKSKGMPDFGELFILPCFESVPDLASVFETHTHPWDGYECKHKNEFVDNLKSAYLKEESPIFKCMSLLYDYGFRKLGKGVLLEVTLWPNIP